MTVLEDPQGRRFPYLRLSVTDVCNFRCTYCLPDGWRPTGPMHFLSVPEIGRLVRAFAELGTWKVRLTGGEPTVRKDILEIAAMVSATPGIRKLAMTTNGYHLPQRAADYRAAGIDALNVSIDSLDPKSFARVTGHDRLDEVMAGVAAARAAGIAPIKINTVLLKGINDGELDAFLNLVRREDLSIRFIELMRTGDNAGYFARHHLSADDLRSQLIEQGWQVRPRAPGAGPAVEMSHPDYRGTIGLIAPYSKDFCKTCNRLRVTARGELQLCLFGDGGFDLRPLLQHEDQREELKARLLALLGHKKASHALHQNHTGRTPNLAFTGG
jgi:cyclic pyranopterin phosphate synthase